MSAPQSSPGRPRIIRLPALREDRIPVGSLVRHAVTWLFAILGTLLLAFALVAALVTVDMTIDASGVLEPRRLWPVRAQEAGAVVQVLVATGDTVAAGQTLIRLDTLQIADALARVRNTLAGARLDYVRTAANRRIEVQQIEERIRRAEASRIRARVSLRQRLVENGFPDSPDSVMQHYRVGTHAAVDLALAEMLAAESDLRSSVAERDLLAVRALDIEKQRTTIAGLTAQAATVAVRRDRLALLAPASGVVLTEQPERLVGAAVREGETLLNLAEPGGWRAVLGVSEQDIHEIHIGDEVKIEVLAFPRNHDLLRGRVVEAGQQPSSVDLAAGPRPGAYRVVVALELDPLRAEVLALRQGYTVRAKIIHRSGTMAALLWNRMRRR